MRTRTGDELKQLRNEAGLSQAKIAKLAQTPLSTWEQWEQNPDSSSSRRPAGIAFAFLEMYIFMKNKGIEYKPEE